MNRSKIEFCDYTWNPIVGCEFSCSYCYARRFNARFNKASAFDIPVFHPDRLALPYKFKKSSKIFVGSMADIFSFSVKNSWIEQILKVVRENPHHTFQFLTKCPKHYQKYDFPKNVWLGTSIASGENIGERQRISDLTSCGCQYISFVLVEPLLGDMTWVDFSAVDFLYVGAMTGPRAIAPTLEWIRSIKHHNIFWKENIRRFLHCVACGKTATHMYDDHYCDVFCDECWDKVKDSTRTSRFIFTKGYKKRL